MSNSERQNILDETNRVREGVQTHRHAPFARHMLRIPEQDFHALVKLFPALASNDPDTQFAAWTSFEKSVYAEPYRVGRVVRGIVKNGVIAK